MRTILVRDNESEVPVEFSAEVQRDSETVDGHLRWSREWVEVESCVNVETGAEMVESLTESETEQLVDSWVQSGYRAPAEEHADKRCDDRSGK